MKNININKTVNPKGLKKDQYDVIIIGAGIGGLVCGCYLAKAGMKVLIVEKNAKPGGYCTSFQSEGFTFDMGIRALGSMREKGKLNIIFNELNLFEKIKIVRTNPYDILISDKVRVNIWNDYHQTLEEFKSNFPQEADGINDFFDFIKNTDPLSVYLELKDKTFDYVVNKFLRNPGVKNIIYLLLQNVGSPVYKASAMLTLFMFREHILDGGYYPVGGMQKLPNTLAENFKNAGGTLLFSTTPKSIAVKNNKVMGIIFQNGIFIKSRFVVSASDITNTFLNLIDKKITGPTFLKDILSKKPSCSAFVVYLGINKSLKSLFGDFGGIWYAPFHLDYNEKRNFTEESLLEKFVLLLCIPSLHNGLQKDENTESVFLFINAPFKSIDFWDNVKDNMAEKIIRRSEELIPSLSKYIVIKKIITPVGFYKYTLNRDGALRGWAAIPSQVSSTVIPREMVINGLYSVGHWSPQIGQGGVILAANSGRAVAKVIKKRITGK